MFGDTNYYDQNTQGSKADKKKYQIMQFDS